MEHIEEDDSEQERLPDDDKFCTLTMAEILERQGMKKDAMRIYQALLKKGGQNSLAIRERIEKLMDDNKGNPSKAYEDRKSNFLNWINKLQKSGA